MQAESTIVRDFIYVDVERLYSLYSQVFKGVAAQIVQSYMGGRWDKDLQKGPILKGASVEAQFAEVSLRTEKKFFYDHMYNQLETEMSGAILEPSGISANNYSEALASALMIKVHGRAEMEDFSRLQTFIEKFNSVAEAIAYAAAISSDEFQTALRELESVAGGTGHREKRTKAKSQIEKLRDPAQLAKKMGLSQDEQLLQNISLFVETFHPGSFEVVIIPAQGVEGVVFRGIVDKQWLRMEPDLLRALYGVGASNWTMVGQLTHLPGIEISEYEIPTEQEVNTEASEEQEAEGAPSMRDPLRSVFEAIRLFENMFLESEERIEVLVCPLAIYREWEMPSIKSSEACVEIGAGSEEKHTTATQKDVSWLRSIALWLQSSLWSSRRER